MCNACGKGEQQKNIGIYYKPEILILKKVIPADESKECRGSFITSDGKIYEYHFDFSDISEYQLSLDGYSYEYIYAYIEEYYKTNEKEFNYIGQLDEKKINEIWTAICQLPNDMEKYEKLEIYDDSNNDLCIRTVYRINHIDQLEDILLRTVDSYEILNQNPGAKELWKACLPYIPLKDSEFSSSTDDSWIYDYE